MHLNPHLRFEPDLFRVLLLRRLRLPLPLSSRTCGVAVSSTALALTAQVAAGVLERLRLASAVKEAGESPPMSSCGTSQLAIDTTLVSLLRADGEPHRRCADESGVALEAARRRKVRG